MHRQVHLIIPALLLAAPLAAQAGAPAARLDSAATIADGRKYTAWFYGGRGDSVFAHSSPAVQAKISATQINDIQGQLVAQVGNEQSVLSERVVARDSLSGYVREARFELMDEPLMIVFTLGRSGEIFGFFIRPRSQMPADSSGSH